MGIRSFLIKFDNLNQIIQFFMWRKYLAKLVCDFYDSSQYLLEDIYEIIKSKPLDIKYNNIDYGDFDVYLMGFKFWAGGIWGLVTTYSVGEFTFELIVQKILRCYYSRLSAIDMEKTNYNLHQAIFIENYIENQNLIEASKIYLKLNNIYKYQLYDYDGIKHIVGSKNIDENNFIKFESNKIIKILNIQNN